MHAIHTLIPASLCIYIHRHGYIHILHMYINTICDFVIMWQTYVININFCSFADRWKHSNVSSSVIFDRKMSISHEVLFTLWPMTHLPSHHNIPQLYRPRLSLDVQTQVNTSTYIFLVVWTLTGHLDSNLDILTCLNTSQDVETPIQTCVTCQDTCLHVQTPVMINACIYAYKTDAWTIILLPQVPRQLSWQVYVSVSDVVWSPI